VAEHARTDGSEADPVGATLDAAPRTADDVTTTAAPAPIARRRKAAAPDPGAAEEPNPAEEMGDVGNDDTAKAAAAEKAAGVPEDTPAAGSTATKTAKPRTAAEIVAEQKAREEAAASASATGSGSDPDDTTATKPVSRVTTPAASAATKTAAVPTKKAPAGKQAMSTVGSGVRQFRNLLASVVWLIAVLAAALLALGALFTALDQTNQSNEIVRWVLERGHDLVGPFKDLFRLETAKNTLLVNWGIAALVYLIAGKILERFIRP
jgi:hypothetical protein